MFGLSAFLVSSCTNVKGLTQVVGFGGNRDTQGLRIHALIAFDQVQVLARTTKIGFVREIGDVHYKRIAIPMRDRIAQYWRTSCGKCARFVIGFAIGATN